MEGGAFTALHMFIGRPDWPVQIKDFQSLYGELQHGAVAKWRQVGTQLDLEDYELDAISAGQSDNEETNMTKVFELWKQQSLKQTWNDLIAAVDSTGCNLQLCEDLKEKYKAGMVLNFMMTTSSVDLLLF